MKNKKIVVNISIILGICICLVCTVLYINNFNKVSNESSFSDPTKILADIYQFKDLNEIKSNSDLIAEVEGTNIQETREYKGTDAIITTVKVKEVFKGDKSIKNVKVIQMKDYDVPPKKGEKLVVFLSKGIDNPDCYSVRGAGQGIYRIINSKSNKEVIKSQSMANKSILKELGEDYENAKKKLSEWLK